MNDLISRQAAIEATWKEPTYSDPLNVLTEVRDMIEALPSAQPEPCEDAVSRLEIIRLILEHGLYCDTQADRETSAEIIRQLPSVQPEIIRCKECLLRYTSCPMVVRHGNALLFFSKDEDFCSYGKGEEE